MRLDPQHIGAASGQRQRLLGKRGLGFVVRQRANRLHDFTGRAHAAGHYHGASAGVGHAAGDARAAVLSSAMRLCALCSLSR